MSASSPDVRALADYAPIGDGRTVALVGTTGRIDWLPLPNLDSGVPFAALLDAAEGGYIALAPVGDYATTRRYLPGTNVLETEFSGPSGRAIVTDGLITGVAGRLPWAQLVRRIEGVEGTLEFTWEVRPGTLLGEASPWRDTVGTAPIIRVDDLSIAVDGDGRLPDDTDEARRSPVVRGRISAHAGSDHVVTIAATHGEPLHVPDLRRARDGLRRTIDGWADWSTEFSFDGPWAPEVQRSALALKLLVYSPTGAIAAAATTSLPENPAGGKNWDYRLAWVRDLAYTAHALVRFGLREETHAAISWMLRTIRDHGPDLHVMYSLRGDLADDATQHRAPGWNGIGPVVSGNPAREQLQLGVFGDLFDICRFYVDAGNVLDVETGRLLAHLADRTCDEWRRADSGMWELPEEQHYVSSKMGCWKALDDAVALGRAGFVPGHVERWAAERDRIADWVHAHGWSDDLQSYVMYPGSTALDTSVLLHAESGFDRGARMSSTIDAVTRELGAGTLLYRYTGMAEEEHTFVASAFWRVAALACVGRHHEALAAMSDLVERSNDVGIFAEMVAADDGTSWGNVPQALSHLALIDAAITIEQLVAPELVREFTETPASTGAESPGEKKETSWTSESTARRH